MLYKLLCTVYQCTLFQLMTSIWLYACCYVYTLYNLFAHSCLYYYLLSIRYTVLHIIFDCTFYSFLFIFFTSFFSYLYLFKFSCVCVTYNCTVHGADLTYISMLLIFCIIMYVMNKILKMQCSASETTFFFAWHHQSLLDFKPSNQPPSLQCVTPFMIQWIAIG